MRPQTAFPQITQFSTTHLPQPVHATEKPESTYEPITCGHCNTPVVDTLTHLSMEELQAHFDDIRRDHHQGQGVRSDENIVLARLLSKVPRIETPEHLNAYLKVLDEFAGLKDIDRLSTCLGIQAKRLNLFHPTALEQLDAIAHINAQYPHAVSVDDMLSQASRWAKSPVIVFQTLLQPYIDWVKTPSGKLLGSHVPPHLQQGFQLLLPVIKDASKKDLAGYLDLVAQLPQGHHNELTDSLLTAVLVRTVKLFESAAVAGWMGVTEEQKLTLMGDPLPRVSQMLNLLCTPVEKKAIPFAGAEAALRNLKLVYDEDLKQGLDKQAAANKFLKDACALLPHIKALKDFVILKAYTGYRKLEADAATNAAYDKALLVHQLQLVLGVVPPMAFLHAEVQGTEHALRQVLLVSPQAALVLRDLARHHDQPEPLIPVDKEEAPSVSDNVAQLKALLETLEQGDIPAYLLSVPTLSKKLDLKIHQMTELRTQAPEDVDLSDRLMASMQALPESERHKIGDAVMAALGYGKVAPTPQQPVVENPLIEVKAHDQAALNTDTPVAVDLAALQAHTPKDAASLQAQDVPEKPTAIPATPASPSVNFQQRLESVTTAYKKSRMGENSTFDFIKKLTPLLGSIATPADLKAFKDATALIDTAKQSGEKKKMFKAQVVQAVRQHVRVERQRTDLLPRQDHSLQEAFAAMETL